MGVTKEDLNLWMEDFLKKESILKYDMQLSGNSSTGEGFLGDITFLKLIAHRKDQKDTTYNLVIKSAKKGDGLRGKIATGEVFEREMFMYNEVFIEFQKIQTEKAVKNPFLCIPKCHSVYSKNQNEAIMLENVKCLGYDVYDRKTPQNLDHSLLIFKNYGKLHALSLALRKQKPSVYKNLTQNLTDLLIQLAIQANTIKPICDGFREGLDLIETEDVYTYQKLQHFGPNEIKNAITKCEKNSEELSVILHGDCWNNNMMFTYEDNDRSRPTDMMFLDFQLSSLGSPIYDLSYYLYSVADEQVLKYFDLLLQTYHYSLTSFLRELGESSYDISLEDIKRHWIEYGKFGLAMAPFIIKIELSEADEVVDIAESAETGDIGEAFNVKIKNTEEYEKRIKAVYKHYASLL